MGSCTSKQQKDQKINKPTIQITEHSEDKKKIPQRIKITQPQPKKNANLAPSENIIPGGKQSNHIQPSPNRVIRRPNQQRQAQSPNQLQQAQENKHDRVRQQTHLLEQNKQQSRRASSQSDRKQIVQQQEQPQQNLLQVEEDPFQIDTRPDPSVDEKVQKVKESKIRKTIIGLLLKRGDARKENFKLLDQKLSEVDIQKIEKIFSRKTFFDLYTQEERQIIQFTDFYQRMNIIKQMFICEVSEGDYLFKQGDLAAYLFILKSGQCELIRSDGNSKKLPLGSVIGEIALLNNSLRSGSIKCQSTSLFYGLNKNIMQKELTIMKKMIQTENRILLDSIPLFDSLTREQKDILLLSLQMMHYSKQEQIYEKFEDAQSFFLIKKGDVLLQGISLPNGTEKSITLQEGTYFGEEVYNLNYQIRLFLSIQINIIGKKVLFA